MTDEQWHQLHGILTILVVYAGAGVGFLFMIVVKLFQIRSELRKAIDG